MRGGIISDIWHLPGGVVRVSHETHFGGIKHSVLLKRHISGHLSVGRLILIDGDSAIVCAG